MEIYYVRVGYRRQCKMTKYGFVCGYIQTIFETLNERKR